MVIALIELKSNVEHLIVLVKGRLQAHNMGYNVTCNSIYSRFRLL